MTKQNIKEPIPMLLLMSGEVTVSKFHFFDVNQQDWSTDMYKQNQNKHSEVYS